MKEVLIDGIRYAPVEPQVDPLAEVKAAHRAGKTIQFRHKSSVDECDWFDCSMWHEGYVYSGAVAYRIKPEPKPDVVVYGRVFRIPAIYTGERTEFADFGSLRNPPDNLCLTFDGETKELKKAEVLQ